MRILIVEDEPKIAANLKRGLEIESYAVDVAHDGEYGYDLALNENYDVIILDRMLPGMDGLEICKRIRDHDKKTPVLMLTAKGEISDRVHGLDSGADDYLVKPFAFEELLARVRALVRRPTQPLNVLLTADDLALDSLSHQVTRDNQTIKLSKKEFALLEFLLRNQGRTLTKDQIIQNIWNFDADVLPNTVGVYIGYLRNKVDKPFSHRPALIHTVRGFGYKLEPPKL